MNVRLLLLLLGTLLYALAYTQSIPEPTFHSLEVDGMGVKSAYFQVWDSRGKLWAVSDKGLLCYNGYQSKIIASSSTDKNSPLSDNLRSIYEVQPDEFWLTYRDQKSISQFDPIKNTFKHFRTDTLNPNRIAEVDLAKIVFDTDSTRWLLTWGEGLFRLNIENEHAVFFKNDDEQISDGEPPVNFVKDMVKLEDDLYLCAFFLEKPYSKPYYFIPSTRKFLPFDFEPYLQKMDERMAYLIKVALSIVNFIHIDSNKNLWFGTYVGLVFLDLQNKIIKRVSGESNDLYRQNIENVRAFDTDQEGRLWITTPNQGIMLVDTETQKVKYLRHDQSSMTGIADDRLSSINTDPLGNIWISTDAGTFSIYNPFVQHFQTHPWSDMKLDFSNRSIQQVPVNQMVVLENGNILISNNNGIVEYNSQQRQVVKTYSHRIVTFKGEINTKIEHFRHVDGLIYFIKESNIKHSDYVVELDYGTSQLKTIPTDVLMHHLLFRHGRKDDPIVFYNHWSPVRMSQYNPSTQRIDSIYQFSSDLQLSDRFTLKLNSGKWMIPLSTGNFLLFDPVTKTEQIYDSKSSTHYFPDSTINCAYKDQTGLIWIGTQTGIYLFDETKNTITKENKTLGLSEKEKVNAITQDHENIFWIALAKDLVRWDRINNTSFTYNKSHGLKVGNFLPSVAQKDSLGNIYIASHNGVLIFNPDDLKIPNHTFEIYLENAFLHDDLIKTDDVLSGKRIFSNNENYLTFEFFTNQLFTLTPTQFYYKLAGRDSDWQDNGISNRIRLADLSYGDYILEIKATNTFGQESNILKIPITIDKPYFLKWWFILLCVVILVVIILILIRYREKALRKKSIELEQIVTERTADVVREKKEADKQRLEAEHQKEIVEEKQKEISDSINYAKRIQNAILPSQRYFQKHLAKSFILYLPKDIVAGDFYFMEDVEDTIILAVADCTGHGVPGAMVSVVCHNALSRSIKEFGLIEPQKILDKTRELVLETFEKSEDQVNDGMDIALCSINKKTNTLLFSGANNGLFLVRKGELQEFKSDKQPIGKYSYAKPFTCQSISIEKGDQFYLYSDGYADQFGGEAGKPGGKKFKYSRLKTLIQEIATKEVEEQHTILNETLSKWRGDIEQIDDVCIIGFRF
jgi:serine phosphatase RsbU (regulator of sigma subunit)/sugar lactone lactonase YvrE